MKKRILIFDDDKDILQLSKAIFTKDGYEVETREDCNYMFQVVSFYKPDLIIVDHQMPGITGAEAIEQLKAHDSFKHIPVIYFSSVNDIAEKAKQIHADAYLQKPAGTTSLLNTVHRLVG